MKILYLNSQEWVIVFLLGGGQCTAHFGVITVGFLKEIPHLNEANHTDIYFFSKSAYARLLYGHVVSKSVQLLLHFIRG